MKKLCIIDDDAIIRKGLRTAIDWESYGCRVVSTYPDGEKAISGLTDNLVPDTAIVDIKMPFINGIEFTKTAASRWPKMEIVILSGFDDFEYVKELFLLGIKDYVLKPVNHSELIMAVCESGSGSRDKNQDKLACEYRSPVDKALDCIYSQYQNPQLCLEYLASSVNLNPVYLSSLFTQKTGKNFVKVLRAIRLEKAKDLLRNSSFSIAEICEEIGFSNPQYFSNIFKKETLKTPMEYRKLAQRADRSPTDTEK